MATKAKITVREFIHYLNAMNEEADVYIDGTDHVIAVCGGDIALTPKGMEKFSPVLDMEMDGHCIIGSDADYDEYEENTSGRLALAWEFIASLAGYCPSHLYKEWFEGDDAEAL